MPTVPVAGDPAPDFALPDENGVIHRLSDRHGWTVVYFYPEDDTPSCTLEACDFRDRGDELVAAGAAVWGISPDDAASHGRFRAKFQLTFPLLSDVDHATAEAYGAWVEKSRDGTAYMGIQRSTFLVAPDGRIAHAWPKVTAAGHAEDVLRTLALKRADRRG